MILEHAEFSLLNPRLLLSVSVNVRVK